ncbi:MAG TPA: DUF4097 family beta strand repeat-containing protein [Thermoanaerobaculia bacterium]
MRYALFCVALFATTAVADVSRTVTASVRRGNVRRVIVDIPAGEINVRNGTAEQISVAGEVRRSDDDDEAQREIKNASLEIVTDGGDAIIRKAGHSDWGWRVHTSYHLDINVPRGTSVELETKYGEITMEGEFGNIDVDLRAGEIHLRTPRAAVRELNASARIGEVHTDFGDDREDHEGILPGTTHFINANGRSRVSLHTTVGELHVTLTR